MGPAPADEDVDKLVLKKFELQQKLGKGAYGIVWKAEKKSTKAPVAVKKIFGAFQNATDAQRTFREILYLKQMDKHENIVQLQGVIRAENDRDIYLIFEYMETDLHAAIVANILEDVHRQYIIYQTFKALMYMHSAGLVHRDMKPANLLLNSECLMKVADFGLARSVPTSESGDAADVSFDVGENGMTDYVATRWYRAPEILFGAMSYGPEVDLWSLGCIFAEMILGKPIFSGASTLGQIEQIVSLLGWPDDEAKAAIDSKFTQVLLDSIDPKIGPDPNTTLEGRWRDIFPNVPDSAISLLCNLLVWAPHNRIKAVDGLTHEYCGAFHDDQALPADFKVKVPEGFRDSLKLGHAAYRDKLYQYIREWKGGGKGERKRPTRRESQRREEERSHRPPSAMDDEQPEPATLDASPASVANPNSAAYARPVASAPPAASAAPAAGARVASSAELGASATPVASAAPAAHASSTLASPKAAVDSSQVVAAAKTPQPISPAASGYARSSPEL